MQYNTTSSGIQQGGTTMTRKELMIEADMLQGNINRMIVTKDLKELTSMYEWAEQRLQTIYRERVKELGDANTKN